MDFVETFEEIQGVRVRFTANSRCFCLKNHLKTVLESIKKGEKKGLISDEYGHRLEWEIQDDIKVGDIVEFSTSGKYNPGFHTTDTYTGVVTKEDDGRYWIRTERGTAIVPRKHIDKVLKSLDSEGIK